VLCAVFYAASGVWSAFPGTFDGFLAEQVRRLEIKVEREKLVLASLPTLSLQIVEFAREHGRVTIGESIRLTGASRNTLKQHFRALVERGYLNQHGSGRGVWYELPRHRDRSIATRPPDGSDLGRGDAFSSLRWPGQGSSASSSMSGRGTVGRGRPWGLIAGHT